MHRSVGALIVFCFATSITVVHGQSLTKSNASEDLDIAHAVLVSQVSNPETRPRNASEWQKLANEFGLNQRERGGPWVRITDEGELRVTPFFLSDTTSYWIMLFPSAADPVPDSILAHFLRDARYTNLDGDQLEIGISPIERLDGGGTKVRNITVSVTGGRLLASRIVIEWK
jgi:hypothetical protein